MPRRRLVLAAAALVVAFSVGSASADPVTPGAFPSFLLNVESLRASATPTQVAAIDAANDLYHASTAATVVGELKLIDKMFKGLDRAFAGNEAYQTAADNFYAGQYITRVSALPPLAMLAAAQRNPLSVGGVGNKILKLTKKLDLNKDGTPAGTGDYPVNRSKFRARAKSLATFCEKQIR